MFARSLAIAALAVTPLAFAAPAFAEDERGSFGYTMGADPQNWQFISAVQFRGHPWGSFSESILSLITRSQQISVSKTYALESFGLGAQLGANLWFLRAGAEAELSWIKKIEIQNGQLGYVNSPGFILGPYVAVDLPFLKTSFTHMDVAVHWPLVNTADPSIGPRVMATLWLGGGPLLDEEELEEELFEEDMPEDTEYEEEEHDHEHEAPAEE